MKNFTINFDPEYDEFGGAFLVFRGFELIKECMTLDDAFETIKNEFELGTL